MNTDHVPDIDAAESLFAIVGVKEVISRDTRRIRRSELAAAARLHLSVVRMARAVVKGDIVDVAFSDFNYKKTLDTIAQPVDQAHAEAMVARLPPELSDLAADFIVMAGKVSNILQSRLPVSTYSTASGTKNLTPNAMAVCSFTSLLEVLDDPLRVFALMAKGALLRAQVAVVREVYPTFSDAVDAAITQAIIDAKTAKASFELPPHAELGVARWFDTDVVSAPMKKALQASFKRPDASPPPAKTDGRTSVAAKEALSPAQQASFVGQTR